MSTRRRPAEYLHNLNIYLLLDLDLLNPSLSRELKHLSLILVLLILKPLRRRRALASSSSPCTGGTLGRNGRALRLIWQRAQPRSRVPLSLHLNLLRRVPLMCSRRRLRRPLRSSRLLSGPLIQLLLLQQYLILPRQSRHHCPHHLLYLLKQVLHLSTLKDVARYCRQALMRGDVVEDDL